MQLMCRARGNPSPTVEWRKLRGEETALISKRSTNGSVEMIIKSVSSEDFGKYLCIAQNWYKTRHFITLQIGRSQKLYVLHSLFDSCFDYKQ